MTKFKIFSNSGEILFSTDPKEIGDLNNQRYFHEIVAKGKVITKGIQKETKSLEGQVMLVDVVETGVMKIIDFWDIDLSKNLSKFIPKVVVILR